MTTPPPEPDCPDGRKPHNERITDIVRLLEPGKTGVVVIDNTPEHRAWYLWAFAQQPSIVVENHNELNKDAYVIRIRKR